MTDGATKQSNAETTYQSAAAFWLTYTLIAVATVSFVWSSYVGMNQILEDIRLENSSVTRELVHRLSNGTNQSPQLAAWAALEFDTLENRQSRADSLLATRTWLRFMNATFGSILIMCGAIFILSRIRIGSTNLEAGNGEFRVVLASSSPGIFMLVLGAFLTVAPLFSNQTITIRDIHSYPAPFNSAIPAGASGYGKALKDLDLCKAAMRDGTDVETYCTEEK